MCHVPNLSVISPKISVKRANLSVRRRPSPCSRVRRRIDQAEALGCPGIRRQGTCGVVGGRRLRPEYGQGPTAGTGSLKRIIVDAIDFGNLGHSEIARDGGTLNRPVSRGLFFGAGFGCAYALVVLLLGGPGGPGLAILSGLGGAMVGAVLGCIIAVLIFWACRLIVIRRDLEKATAAVITGASTLLILMALASTSDSKWPWWTNLVSAGAAALVGGLAWPRTKTVVGESR